MKSRVNSLYNVRDGPRIVIFDGAEEKKEFKKRVFKERSIDNIRLHWESTPMTTLNDHRFIKINNVTRNELDLELLKCASLPQVHKRKNNLQNECFAISPQTTQYQVNKFGKYADRYTRDADIFGTKIPTQQQFQQTSGKYGQFYFAPDYKMTKQKPVYTYHTAKSQVLGNRRLNQIKFKNEE